MTADRVPILPRGVRCQFDKIRKSNVLLGPERVLMLDGTGHAILSAVDGTRSLDAIATHLADLYAAPKQAILDDVIEFLDDLAGQKLVDYTHV